MNKDVHPKYQKVIFLDSSTGQKILCGSALQTDETDTFEGVEYPLCRAASRSPLLRILTSQDRKSMPIQKAVWISLRSSKEIRFP